MMKNIDTKFGGIQGHVPEKVRLVILKNYSDKNKPTNKQWFDLRQCPGAKDWSLLDLPDSNIPQADMSAPKKAKNISQKDIVIDNKPVKIKLASAEQTTSFRTGKKEGFKVILPQGYIVDIHADVFFEALMKDGFNSKTKELNSEFIIVTLSRVTRLVRVNSDLHKACLERMELDLRPKIDVKTMAPGEVYETTTGTKGLFLGFVTTKYLKCSKQTRARRHNHMQVAHVGQMNYSRMKIGSLWVELGYGLKTTSSKALQQSFDERLRSNSYFLSTVKLKTKSGHGFVNKVSKLKINVPLDIIQLVRLDAIKRQNSEFARLKLDNPKRFENWIDKCLEQKGKRTNPHYPLKPNFTVPQWWNLQEMISLTKYTNMTVFGMTPEPHESSVQLEKFIKLYNKVHELNLDPSFRY